MEGFSSTEDGKASTGWRRCPDYSSTGPASRPRKSTTSCSSRAGAAGPRSCPSPFLARRRPFHGHRAAVAGTADGLGHDDVSVWPLLPLRGERRRAVRRRAVRQRVERWGRAPVGEMVATDRSGWHNSPRCEGRAGGNANLRFPPNDVPLHAGRVSEATSVFTHPGIRKGRAEALGAGIDVPVNASGASSTAAAPSRLSVWFHEPGGEG
jgi:hypothetical protein